VASYALTVSAAEALGRGWEVRWVLVSGAVSYTVTHPLVVCEYVPTCTVGDEQLYTLLPELADRVPERQSAVGWQPQISAAYQGLLELLLRDQRPVEYLRTVAGAQEYLTQRALLLCLEAIGQGGEGSYWGERITATRARALAAEARLSLIYSDEPGRGLGSRPLSLSSPGRW
jgi:hypothetical protein